jgi:hypothetical protein
LLDISQVFQSSIYTLRKVHENSTDLVNYTPLGSNPEDADRFCLQNPRFSQGWSKLQRQKRKEIWMNALQLRKHAPDGSILQRADTV